MPKVKKLDKKIYELIAAGEVIERPGSIVKELAENSIDSGASSITVEIKRGGITYMRITDNGCGIDPEDVSTAFLRHATSKIATEDDLNDIRTLGFRGEALASVAAVAKVEVLTKPRESELGTHYIIEGTEEKLCESCGCPDGTTMIVRDIFYNVPARLKFLKKDVAEGNDVAKIVEKMALSHPEISVKLIRDNKQVLFTPGDNNLYSAIYSVFGKQFAASLIPVDYSMNGIRITGFTVKPLFGPKTRRMQNFFVNGRYVQSVTCMLALEEAYKNCIMEGKFPACVLMMEISPSMLDVNVHPQKTEVRFTAERAVYEAVYFAVRNAVLSDSEPSEIVIPQHKENYRLPEFADKNTYEQTEMNVPAAPVSAAPPPVNRPPQGGQTEQPPQRMSAEEYRSSQGVQGSGQIPAPPTRITAEYFTKVTGIKIKPQPPKPAEASPAAEDIPEKKPVPDAAPPAEDEIARNEENAGTPPAEIPDDLPLSDIPAGLVPQNGNFKYIDKNSFEEKTPEPQDAVPVRPKEIPYYRFIGEAFATYIIAETEEDVIFVDKHAAHERINFERLRSGEEKLSCQMLLEPVELRLEYSQYEALAENIPKAEELGFSFEMLTPPAVSVRGIPTILDILDAGNIAAELAQRFDEMRHDPMPDALDDLLHSIACKASIRGNDKNSPAELTAILDRLFSDETIRYCPHGRPVMFKLKKRELEKQFRRIV